MPEDQNPGRTCGHDSQVLIASRGFKRAMGLAATVHQQLVRRRVHEVEDRSREDSERQTAHDLAADPHARAEPSSARGQDCEGNTRDEKGKQYSS